MLKKEYFVVTSLAAAGVLVFLLLPQFTWAEDAFKVLHAFTWANGPEGVLARDADGNLYGTTVTSKVGEGTVWKLTPHSDGTWTTAILHVFSDRTGGELPWGGVILDRVGNLYGTTEGGGGSSGSGVVFKLSYTSSGWHETVLHRFNGNDGAAPIGPLTLDTAGNLYGTTSEGGSGACGCGVAFRLAPNSDGTWRETVLHTFIGGADGGNIVAGLTLDAVGNLYGATNDGGAGCFSFGCGLIFKLSLDVTGKWTYSVLHRFTGPDGENPVAGLTFDAAGNLYGTAFGGSSFGNGVVFKLAPNSDGTWSETVLHSFHGRPDGAYPFVGVTFDPHGDLYGTTNIGGTGGGIVYKLTPTSTGWAECLVHSFESNGFSPLTPILIDPRGHLYGTTNAGRNGNGFVFEITP